MPPQANEHTQLVDEEGLPNNSSANTAVLYTNNNDDENRMDYFNFKNEKKRFHNSSNPNSLRQCRVITMWTIVTTILISITVVGVHKSFPLIFKDERGREFISSASTAVEIDDTIQKRQQHTKALYTNSKYKKVQGIGFQIYTGGAPAFLGHNHSDGTPILNPECIGQDSYGQVVGEVAPMMQCYIGIEDPMLDVRGRIEIMMDAVEKAYVLADNDDEETLKIFIAPEFYWRGITGAYSFEYDELPNDPSFCGPICQILMGLENIVAQKRFENWVFLFGTIVASDKLPTDDPYDYLFYNFAPLYKGYDPNEVGFVGKRFLLPKRYVSSSDFLTPQRHLVNASSFKQLIGQPPGDTTVYNPHDFNQRRYDPTMWKKYKDELNALGYTMIEYDWLMIDGLSFTLEVCFDHQMRTALNTYLADIVTGRQTLIPSSSDDGLSYVNIPQYQAQVSVVSSAGMTVTPDSLALTNGGTIFLQDGLSNVSNRMIWSDDGCEQGLQFEGGTEGAQRRAFLSSTDIIFDHKALLHFERHDLYKHWHTALEKAFSTKVYKPEIIVFDPVDIAEVSH